MAIASLEELAELTELVQQNLEARIAAVLGKAPETGYPAQALTACTVILLEFDETFASYEATAARLALPPDQAPPPDHALPRRLAQLRSGIRQRLNESSLMAAIRVVREEMLAFLQAEPATTLSTLNLSQLIARRDRLQRMHLALLQLEPRMKALAAQGILPNTGRDWFDPTVATIQGEMAAAQTRLEAFAKPVGAIQPAQANTTVGLAALQLLRTDLRTALAPLEQKLHVLEGNLWADKTPIFNAMLSQYEILLARLKPLAVSAETLAKAGEPQLSNALAQQKDEITRAADIVRQILGDRVKNNGNLQEIARQIDADRLDHITKLNAAQAWMTAVIHAKKI